MDNELFGGNNTPENNEPENNTAEKEDYAQTENENDFSAAENETADAVSSDDSAASGEYHYNKEQYNTQFNSYAGGNNTVNNQQNYSNNQVYGNSQYQYGQQNGYQYQNGQQGSYQPQNGYSGGYQSGYQNGYQYGSAPAYNNGNAPKKKKTGLKIFIAMIVVIVLLSFALIAAIFSVDKNSFSDNSIVSEEATIETPFNPGAENVGGIEAGVSSNAAGEAAEVARIAKKYNVGILVYQNNSLYTEGSGVIVKEDDDGKYTYIITCAHVVNHNKVALSVLMEDGTEYPADLVGMDTRTDLAVVRIEAAGLPKAEIASSSNLIVGQYIYAVGNPGGSEFFGSVTNGIVSAIDRPVSSNTGYEMECIQHTAAINPGNSGGALVNGEGQLIGINSMKIASTEYEGMGFAVPSDVVVNVFNSIIENGYVAGRAKLGISYTTPSNYSQTYAMYVQMKGLPTGTIVIAGINEDSDLANKDVKKGDMIIAVNGKKMENADMLSAMIENMSAGDTLTLTIVRVNTDNWTQTERDVKVTLVEDKGTTTPTADEDSDSNAMPENPFGSNGGYQDWYEFYKDYFGY